MTDVSRAVPPVIPDARLRFMLWVLMFSCALNFLDRQVINILAEPIKLEFGLTDAQLGSLTGLAFALFHAAFSLPVARLADRTDRSAVLAASTLAWSLATIASGFTSTFAQLVAARMAVGAGEAGGVAPAHALIADCTPRHMRARALGFYSAGIPLGGLIGMVLGGFLLDAVGWRIAFIVAGLPGLVLAPLIYFAVRDPRRGRDRNVPTSAQPGFSEIAAEFASNRSFVLVTVAGALMMFVNFSQAAFLASFFFRVHSEPLASLASGTAPLLGAAIGAASLLGLVLGLTKGVGGIVGSVLGGEVTDRYDAGGYRAYTLVPAIVGLLRVPVFAAALLINDTLAAFALLALHAVLAGIGSVGGFAAVQSLVRPDHRATAAAVYAMGINLIGLGLGPLTVGLLSDWLAASGLGPAEGLRWSLLILSSMLMVPVVALGWAASRTIARDGIS